MPCSIRSAALVGAVVLAMTAPARADDCPAPVRKRTVTITDCVEEKVLTTCTRYRTECRTVNYETVRCQTKCVPEQRTCNVTKRIPYHACETRKVYCPTWSWEERPVMKPCYEYKSVTTTVKKCVSSGHWECQTVCAKPGLCGRIGHGGCDDNCCHTTTKKVWVHCPVYENCPVTKCVKICHMKPELCRVKVCHPAWKEVQVKVCKYHCVTEQVTKTVWVPHVTKVPCQAVRHERVCIPYQEQVWTTRLVPRTREMQVEEAVGCCTPCCRTCEPRCPRACHGLRFRESCCN